MPQEPPITALPEGAIQAECPRCGRWLVLCRPDGSFDLAGKAAVAFQVDVGDGRPKGWPDPRTARCLRLRCRLRSWWRR